MYQDDQGFWNFIFTLFFGVVFFGLGYILYKIDLLPVSVSLFDAILIALATFRATRLFVYDKITQFVRDWFLDKEIGQTEEGEYVIVREKPAHGPRRTIAELLACPWCFGIWAGLFICFFYFLTPFAWFPIFVLAISAVGTLFQLLANMVGWRAERLKQEAGEGETFDSSSLPR